MLTMNDAFRVKNIQFPISFINTSVFSGIINRMLQMVSKAGKCGKINTINGMISVTFS